MHFTQSFHTVNFSSRRGRARASPSRPTVGGRWACSVPGEGSIVSRVVDWRGRAGTMLRFAVGTVLLVGGARAQLDANAQQCQASLM